jgi:hypothetical protein
MCLEKLERTAGEKCLRKTDVKFGEFLDYHNKYTLIPQEGLDFIKLVHAL